MFTTQCFMVSATCTGLHVVKPIKPQAISLRLILDWCLLCIHGYSSNVCTISMSSFFTLMVVLKSHIYIFLKDHFICFSVHARYSLYFVSFSSETTFPPLLDVSQLAWHPISKLVKRKPVYMSLKHSTILLPVNKHKSSLISNNLSSRDLATKLYTVISWAPWWCSGGCAYLLTWVLHVQTPSRCGIFLNWSWLPGQLSLKLVPGNIPDRKGGQHDNDHITHWVSIGLNYYRLNPIRLKGWRRYTVTFKMH